MGPQTQTSIARCKKDMHHICPRYFTVTLPSHLSRQRQRHLLHSLVRLRLLSVIRRKLKTVASFPGRACIRTVPVRDTLNVTTRHTTLRGRGRGPGEVSAKRLGTMLSLVPRLSRLVSCPDHRLLTSRNVRLIIYAQTLLEKRGGSGHETNVPSQREILETRLDNASVTSIVSQPDPSADRSDPRWGWLGRACETSATTGPHQCQPEVANWVTCVERSST